MQNIPALIYAYIYSATWRISPNNRTVPYHDHWVRCIPWRLAAVRSVLNYTSINPPFKLQEPNSTSLRSDTTLRLKRLILKLLWSSAPTLHSTFTSNAQLTVFICSETLTQVRSGIKTFETIDNSHMGLQFMVINSNISRHRTVFSLSHLGLFWF